MDKDYVIGFTVWETVDNEDFPVEVESGTCETDDIVDIVESYPSYDGYTVVFEIYREEENNND